MQPRRAANSAGFKQGSACKRSADRSSRTEVIPRDPRVHFRVFPAFPLTLARSSLSSLVTLVTALPATRRAASPFPLPPASLSPPAPPPSLPPSLQYRGIYSCVSPREFLILASVGRTAFKRIKSAVFREHN